jgi:hypothetical protein
VTPRAGSSSATSSAKSRRCNCSRASITRGPRRAGRG